MKPSKVESAREVAAVAGFAVAMIGLGAFDWRIAAVVGGSIVCITTVAAMAFAK